MAEALLSLLRARPEASLAVVTTQIRWRSFTIANR